MSATTSQQVTHYRQNYRPHDYAILETHLTIYLDRDATRVVSQLKLCKQHTATTNTLQLDGEQLTLESIAIDERELSQTDYRVTSHALIIENAPDSFILKTTVCINPAANTALEGLYISSNNFCTQCEAEGFRKITYYIDRPDNLSVYTVKLIADKQQFPVLLSNGNLIESGDIENGQHYALWHDPFPKPSYLFALVAGDLAVIEDTYTTKSGRDVACRIYVEHHNADKCEHAMQSLKQAMQWDEQRFGLEYDLDIYMIVAVDDFNMGAMENKGLNVFNSKFVLAAPETATDDDYQNIAAVIAHEYFHNWTGNRVTCRDWFQLSLKEGLTVFRDQEFSADIYDRAVKRIQDVRLLRTHQFTEDAGPMAHPIRPDSYIEINNFYTLTVYEKGAEVIRMQHTLLGEATFQKGMQVYFERHDGQAVTCEDFVAAMEAGSAIDLKQFRLWYAQAGTPRITFTDSFSENTYTLHIKQTLADSPGQKNKKPMLIPIHIGLLDQAGKEINSQKILLKDSEAQFTFSNLAEKPTPSLLRDFSAPVNYDYAYSEAQLQLLAKHDSNNFARWEAMQRLSLHAIELALQEQNNFSALIDAYLFILNEASQENIDFAYAAELLTLPSEKYIAEQQERIYPEKIHHAYKTLKQAIAKATYAQLHEVYVQLHDNDAYLIDNASIGRRSLQNTCLAYMSSLADSKPDVVDLAVLQYRQANNMTDKFAALQAISKCSGQLREDILADFYEHYKDQSLVVDKWFSVQAMNDSDNVLEQVKQLMQHPAFSMKVPNKVRALIGVFVNGNMAGFHRADGAGYQFLKDCVLALNAINPQVAARMVSVFNTWRRFATPQQTQMQAVLEEIARQPNLSNDVYEIVSKALASK